jgi:hypothetical protein
MRAIILIMHLGIDQNHRCTKEQGLSSDDLELSRASNACQDANAQGLPLRDEH